MIPRTAIEERVREWGLREDIVEKDYVCAFCKKRFTRRSISDIELNEHKAPQGYRCPGSGALGFFVGTRYG